MRDEDYNYLRRNRPTKRRGILMKGHIKALKAVNDKLVRRLYMNYQPINPSKKAAGQMDKAKIKIKQAIKILEDMG